MIYTGWGESAIGQNVQAFVLFDCFSKNKTHKTSTNLFLIIIKIMQLGEKERESACGVCDCECM